MFDKVEEQFQQGLEKTTNRFEVQAEAIMRRKRVATTNEIVSSINAESEASKIQEQTE